MNVYYKYLKRMGLTLIVVSVLDLVGGLLVLSLAGINQNWAGFYLSIPVLLLKDLISFASGVVALLTHRGKMGLRWALIVEIILLLLILPLIMLESQGNLDTLIDLSLIIMFMVVYTLVQCRTSLRLWQRAEKAAPIALDLRIEDSSHWFDPTVIGPHLELNGSVSAAVDRFLTNVRYPAPLEIVIYGLGDISEPMRATMRDIFIEHYEDEIRRVNLYLENLYARTITLTISSLIALFIWVTFLAGLQTSVFVAILSNFAAFSLWQIGSTHYDRSSGNNELLRMLIAKHAKIVFL